MARKRSEVQPVILTATIRDDVGDPLGILVLKPCVFASGRHGWRGVGKAEVDGVRCQCQAQAVVIGKPLADEGGEADAGGGP
jgi:hypothetical protein